MLEIYLSRDLWDKVSWIGLILGRNFVLKTVKLLAVLISYQHDAQPQVSSASVNLTTETAIVWPVSEAKVASNWQKEVGEALAKHLTSCGFTSNLRGLHLDL